MKNINLVSMERTYCFDAVISDLATESMEIQMLEALEDGGRLDALPYFAFEMMGDNKGVFNEWKSYMLDECTDSLQMNFIIELQLDEWMNRRTSNGRKLGKQLKALGFEQYVLDYDGSFERVNLNERYGLIFNPCVWSRAGMSSLAKLGTWNGFNGSSCQDIRHDDCSYVWSVLGSLVNEYFTVQLVRLNEGEKLEELNTYESMKDRLLARSNAFIAGDGTIFLNGVYGNNATTKIFGELVDQLNQDGLRIADVYDVGYNNSRKVAERVYQVFEEWGDDDDMPEDEHHPYNEGVVQGGFIVLPTKRPNGLGWIDYLTEKGYY
jgi:hypothetical protein|nr:MAG TPA: hypothetical protein [Caudoviricetes sp.]